MTAQAAFSNVPRVRRSQPSVAMATPLGDDLLGPDDLLPAKRKAAVRTETRAPALKKRYSFCRMGRYRF